MSTVVSEALEVLKKRIVAYGHNVEAEAECGDETVVRYKPAVGSWPGHLIVQSDGEVKEGRPWGCPCDNEKCPMRN